MSRENPTPEENAAARKEGREVMRRIRAEQAKCNHAWVLNMKPAICLWCGARKQSRR